MERKEAVLLVDDDQNLLSSLRRQLRGRFNVATACGGEEALCHLAENEDVSVIVSDMSMPQMNGVQLLKKVRALNPEIVRIMLTGNADLDTAMQAVNKGGIFRFLVKPCDSESLEIAIKDGIDQFHLIRAEKELLEKTLAGSVKVFSDILALVNPAAFSRASRVQKYCRQVAESLDRENVWRFELAALLSQVGCVALPTDTLAKLNAGADLTADEQKMYARHPSLGAELLSNIPRLEEVSKAIAGQHKEYSEYEDPDLSDDGVFGGMLLKTLIDFDSLIAGGHRPEEAIADLRRNKVLYEPGLLKAAGSISIVNVEWESMLMPIYSLTNEMYLAEDLITKSGLLLAKHDQEMGPSMKARLENFASRNEIPREIRVKVQRGVIHDDAEQPLPLPS